MTDEESPAPGREEQHAVADLTGEEIAKHFDRSRCEVSSVPHRAWMAVAMVAAEFRSGAPRLEITSWIAVTIDIDAEPGLRARHSSGAAVPRLVPGCALVFAALMVTRI